MSTGATKICPCCGAEIPFHSTACRECGSDERTGWSEQTYLDGIDVGDEIEYEALKDAEFNTGIKKPVSWMRFFVAFLLLMIFVIMLVKSF